MSYAEIVGFNKEGDAYSQADIHNAFRGAMAIWRAMEENILLSADSADVLWETKKI